MSDNSERRPGWLALLAAAHDALSRATFIGAAACLSVIVVAYCYEVVARYFFNAPTSWAAALVSYSLCGVVFLATPELTRRNIHIVIDVVLDRLPERWVVYLQHVVTAAGAASCLFTSWIVGSIALSQYQQGIQTILNWPIAKWPLTAVIAYGLLSAGIYFLRHLAGMGRHPAVTAEVS